MLTPTISPILGREEQQRTLLTQTDGNGNGTLVPARFTSSSNDDEGRAAVREAEAHLLRQRINHFLEIVTAHGNEMRSRNPLREQHGDVTLDLLDEGGATWVM